MIRTLAAGLIFAATPLWGGDVVSVNYADLARQLPGLVDFEGFASRPEPGQIAPGVLAFPGASIGSLLQGQTRRTVGKFDHISGIPQVPVTATLSNRPAALAIAFHAGFGSNAAFPIGPDGFSKRSGRGEGSVAFTFKAGTSGFGLKLHADYADPLGSRPAPGVITLTFYDKSGATIAQHDVLPDHGVNEFGFLTSPAAHAVTLTHRDPGGIAIDDIRYSLDSLGS